MLTLVASVAACSNPDSPIPDPPGDYVEVRLVEGFPSPPVLEYGICVITMYVPTADEVRNFQQPPAITSFVHLGESVFACMRGTVQQDIAVDQKAFFNEGLWINTDGKCPPGYAGCYYELNPTIDRAQAFSDNPQDWYEPALLGHEIWHAVAGRYHD